MIFQNIYRHIVFSIIGLGMIFIFIFSSGIVLAEDTKNNGIYLNVCQVVNEENKYLQKFNNQSTPAGRYAGFEAIKTEYHEEINDLFNEYVEELSSSFSKEGSSSEICGKLPNVQKVSMVSVTHTMEKKLHLYSCALQEIAKNPVFDTSQPQSFLQGQNNLYQQEFIFLEEVENAHAAMNITLQTYGELQLWYPVHRDLQCLIQELTLYKTSLRKFIDRVVILPAKYLNYGSREQQ